MGYDDDFDGGLKESPEYEAHAGRGMDKQIDYAMIAGQSQRSMRIEIAEREIERVGIENVTISDALVNRDRGGGHILEYLERVESQGMFDQSTGYHNPALKPKYILRVLRNEWGDEPPTVREVLLKRMRPYRDKSGRKLTTRAVNDIRRRGGGAQFEEVRRFEVDSRGCISCEYRDAATLLTQSGVHYNSGFAITGKRETSRSPSKAPDGNMRTIWYWLYKEVPPWEYESLPVLTPPTTNAAEKSGSKRATPTA